MPTGTAATTARSYHTDQTHYLVKRVGFADSGTAVTVGIVPAGSIVVNGWVVVATAFNAGSTNVIDVGTSADDDGFATDLALGTIGNIAFDEMATTNDSVCATDTTIIATPALSGTAATAGVAYVVVQYVRYDRTLG